jgi:hypothetical protein
MEVKYENYTIYRFPQECIGFRAGPLISAVPIQIVVWLDEDDIFFYQGNIET